MLALLSRQMVGLSLTGVFTLILNPYPHISSIYPNLRTLVVGEVLEVFLVREGGDDPRCEKIQPLLICARCLLSLICLEKHTCSHFHKSKNIITVFQKKIFPSGKVLLWAQTDTIFYSRFSLARLG